MITLIAALAKNGVIGHNGKLPWNIPEELAHFKRTTWGHPVLMGRKTYEAFFTGPLPGRDTIVVSRRLPAGTPGIRVHSSLADVLAEYARSRETLFVIGGADVFQQSLPLADSMILSHLPAVIPGDAYFPAVASKQWSIQNTRQHHHFTVITYQRL